MTFDRRTAVAAQDASAALSSVARLPGRRQARSGLIASVAAVVVGSMTGGALALRGQQPAPASEALDRMRSAASPTSPPPGAAGGTAAAPAGPEASPPLDLRGAAMAQIHGAVMRFVLWSHDHPGARCPDAAALGAVAVDPWGRSLRILCADQPADQVAGVLSLGPDGLPGTADDVASWMLGPDVTDLVRGAPWGSIRSVPASAGAKRPPVPAPHRAGPPGVSGAASPARQPPATPSTRPSASAGAGGSDTDGDGIPDRR